MNIAIPKLDVRTIAKGFGIYVFVALLVPVVAVFIASLGSSEWVAEYIAPAKRFQFLLIVGVGAVVAWLSRSHPLVHAASVGALGGGVSLLFVVVSGAAPHLGVLSAFVHYALMAVVWCVIGALAASLFLRGRYAL